MENNVCLKGAYLSLPNQEECGLKGNLPGKTNTRISVLADHKEIMNNFLQLGPYKENVQNIPKSETAKVLQE